MATTNFANAALDSLFSEVNITDYILDAGAYNVAVTHAKAAVEDGRVDIAYPSDMTDDPKDAAKVAMLKHVYPKIRSAITVNDIIVDQANVAAYDTECNNWKDLGYMVRENKGTNLASMGPDKVEEFVASGPPIDSKFGAVHMKQSDYVKRYSPPGMSEWIIEPPIDYAAFQKRSPQVHDACKQNHYEYLITPAARVKAEVDLK